MATTRVMLLKPENQTFYRGHGVYTLSIDATLVSWFEAEGRLSGDQAAIDVAIADGLANIQLTQDQTDAYLLGIPVTKSGYASLSDPRLKTPAEFGIGPLFINSVQYWSNGVNFSPVVAASNAIQPDFNLSQSGKITAGSVSPSNAILNARVFSQDFNVIEAKKVLRVSKNPINGDETVIHEAAATNLLANATDLTTWAATNVSIGTPLSALNLSMGEVVDTVSGSVSHRISLNAAIIAGDTVRTQAIFKAGTKSWVKMWLFNATDGDIAAAWFDLTNGVVGTIVAGTTATINELGVGTGLYLCSVAGVSTAATVVTNFMHICDADNANNYAGDGTGTIYMSAFLCEKNPVDGVKTPILTTGSTIARTKDGINFPVGVIDQAHCIVLMKLRIPFDATETVNQGILGFDAASAFGPLYLRSGGLRSYDGSQESVLIPEIPWVAGDIVYLCCIADRNNNQRIVGLSLDKDLWQWEVSPNTHDGWFYNGEINTTMELFQSTVHDYQLYDLTVFNTLGDTRNLESARQIVETDANYGRDRNYHVFIAAGQSNVFSGEGKDITDVYPAGVKEWGRDFAHANFIWPAAEPLENTGALSTRIGFMRTFIDDYITATGTDPKDILIIAVAQGSTGFTSHWNAGDPNYVDLVTRATAAMNRYPNAVLKGLMWHQGEQDSGANTVYAAKLDATLNQFRVDIPRASGMKIVTGQVLPSRADVDTNFAAIEAIQRDTPNRISNCAFVDMRSPTLVTSEIGDNLHYDAPAQRIQGNRYYTAWATL